MKRLIYLVIVLTASISLSGLPVFAQKGRGQGGGPPQGIGGPGSQGGPAGQGPAQTGVPGAKAKGPEMSKERGRGAGPDTPGGPAANKPPNMKAADQLARNEHLSARLQRMLPEGADLQNEAAGFRNLGQFVAAVNVSKNLDVPFDELKAEMLGPSDGSLGRAIQALKSDLPPETVQAEAKKAKQEAKQEIKRAKEEAKVAEKQAKAQNRSQTKEQ